jgi:phosphatidylserine/phosphatidylglycerophosphate/cardiolipin synthase-like enzyme
MEKIVQYFVDQFEKGVHQDLPGDIIEALNQLDRRGRGDLKTRLFNEAKHLSNHSHTLQAVQWLENTFIDIEKNSFRYHKVLFSPGSDIPETLTFLLNRAVKTIDLCVFTISDDRLARHILEAMQRGVKIRIISDDRKTYDHGSQVYGLSQAGIHVKIDHSRYHMHHKFGVIDNRIAFSGSYNWTYTATQHNQENLIVTTNYDIVHQYTAEFGKLWGEMFDL